MKTKLLFKYIPATLAVTWALLFGGESSDFAASTTVTVGGTARQFFPAVVSINAGDQVIWTWAGTHHSTTSGTNGLAGDDNGVPSGAWDSTVILTLPHSFTNTFTAPGSYAYFCSTHYIAPYFMTGAVYVASSSLPPALAITNPLPGAVFAAPANVTIQAAVTNGSATVTNVQFLVGADVLANLTAAPFSATTNNLPAGGYTLTAIAADDAGLTATNSVNVSVVTPLAVALTNSAVGSPGNFQFSYSVNTGLTYVVQWSTNLAGENWFSVATNTATSNPAVFVDLNATNTPVFYRVGRMPNP